MSFTHLMSLNFAVKAKTDDLAFIRGEAIIKILEARIAEIKASPEDWEQFIDVYDTVYDTQEDEDE